MNIFQIVNNISFDEHAGGAEMFALRLANEIATDYNSHLVSVWRYGSRQEANLVEHYKSRVTFHFLLEAQPRKKFVPRTLWNRMKLILTEFDPLVINSHSALPDFVNVLIKLLDKKKRKLIRTMHTDRNWIKNRFLEGILVNLIFPFVFNCEVGISQATKHRLDTRWISKIIHKESVIIPNGIADEVLDYGNSIDLKIKKRNVNTLVTAGRLTEQKGYTFLLQAIRILKQERPDVAENLLVNVLGTGPLKESLQIEATRLGVTDIVQFLGYREDALNLVSTADLFISSSLWEGIPTVLLEAMALSLPIIATDIPGTREIIQDQHSGILIPPGNPQKLAQAIIDVITNPEMVESYITNAMTTVYEYRMESVKQKYLSLYDQ